MSLDVKEWATNAAFKKSEVNVRAMNMVNDCAEHGVKEGAAPAECAAGSWTWPQPTAKPSPLQTQANPWIGRLLLGDRWGDISGGRRTG